MNPVPGSASRPDVIVERRGEVAWITLGRPERRNAYDAEMAEQMINGVRASADAALIVITGTDGAFCAGGYLANLADAVDAEIRAMFDASFRLFDEIRRSPRPVLAAVNGGAFGGGNELVVACDFAIAVRSAAFGQTGPRVGSAPVLGGTNMLTMSVGEKRGKEISMLCRRYTAEQALGLGWINEVVDDGALEAAVEHWCEEILLLSPRYLARSPRSARTSGGTRRATTICRASGCSARRSAPRTCARVPRRSWRSAGRCSVVNMEPNREDLP